MLPRHLSRVALVPRAAALLTLLVGCASGGRAQVVGAPDSEAKTRRPGETIRLSRTIVTPSDAASIDELYDRAARDLKAGRKAEAIRGFERVFSLDPEGRLAPHALFQAAQARDEQGELQAALNRYQQLARRYPNHELTREALVRSVRLLAFLEQWQAAGAVADALLARYSDLGAYDSVVAYSGKALALVFAGDVTAANTYIEKGRNVIDDNRLDAAGRVPRDLAQLYYALGELRRIRAERIRLSSVPSNFASLLEERCQLLLDAQSAYSDTMRAYDAHWSAMAGFRVGELYQKLHEELMSIPAPKSADSERRKQLFEGAMRLRYSILLSKAVTMMEHTLSMAERTHERSGWVLRAEEAKRRIETAIKLENAALDRLPYTRSELQDALDNLPRNKKMPPEAVPPR